MQGLIDHVYQSMFLRILPTSSSSHNEKNLIQRIHLWQGLLNWASWYLVASQQVPWGIAVGTLAHLAMWLSSRFEAHLRSQNNQPEPNIYGNVWCRMQVVKDANLFFFLQSVLQVIHIEMRHLPFQDYTSSGYLRADPPDNCQWMQWWQKITPTSL